MKTISDVYKEYKIMPSLGLHMLRVASVTKMIADNFDGVLDKKKITTVALLHDMGNMIKAKLDLFPEFLEPEGLAYWQEVKDEFILKFGNDEYEATMKIIKELGLPEIYATLANQNRFSMLCAHKNSNDFNVKILHYADMRVAPHGILSYEDRMVEARNRYKNLKTGISDNEREMLTLCGKEMENQIFSRCKISPEEINDQAIAPLVKELENFVLETTLFVK